MLAKRKSSAALGAWIVLIAAQSVLGAEDWPMLGRTPTRNPVVADGDPPLDWNIGRYDRRTRQWDMSGVKGVKWQAKLGSVTYGTPVVANGQVYVGTNNGAGYLERYPNTVDLGCLLCFRESDGQFLWQFSAEKLPIGRIHDWPMQGIGCPPLVEGERMWLISNRWEVLCLDTQGFRDGQNDGPYGDEPVKGDLEADVVWKLDIIGQLGVHPHPAGMGPDRRCSIAAWNNRIYVVTGNGVHENQMTIPTPDAPSLVCLDKRTGSVLWTDNSPGKNILDTQIASPLVAQIAGQVQVVVPQGDGWLRSFQADTGELIWEFDINPKTAKWNLGRGGIRNDILATPVLYEDRIYIANGHQAEHGNGQGRLVCVDPTKTGDISAELAVDEKGNLIPHRRLQAVNVEKGEKAIANPNSGLIWEFTADGDDLEDEMHRTLSSVAVHHGLVVAADFGGFVHCLDALTGKKYWTYDSLANIWASPLVVGDIIYVPDEDGEIAIFRLSADPQQAMKSSPDSWAFVDGEPVDLAPIHEINVGLPVYASPIYANGTLYIATRNTLYAIAADGAESRVRSRTDGDLLQRVTMEDRKQHSNARVPRAAFVTTPQDVVEKMLELAQVQADEVVCDLGSGDGRIPVTAAKKYRAKGIGYELDRELLAESIKAAEAQGVAERVRFYEVDLLESDLTDVDVVTLYLYPAQNRELLPRLRTLKAGARIVTHHYPLPDTEPDKTWNVQSKDSGETHTVYLYTLPLTTLSGSAKR